MKTTKAIKMSTDINGNRVRASYKASEITNRTNDNMWVVFESNNPKNALVFSKTLDRTTARYAMAKILGTNIVNIRSRKVKNYTK